MLIFWALCMSKARVWIFFIMYDQCWSWPLSWSLTICKSERDIEIQIMQSSKNHQNINKAFKVISIIIVLIIITIVTRLFITFWAKTSGTKYAQVPVTSDDDVDHYFGEDDEVDWCYSRKWGLFGWCVFSAISRIWLFLRSRRECFIQNLTHIYWKSMEK